MKSFLPLLILVSFAHLGILAQPLQATLLGHWADEGITPTVFFDSPYSDVWGVVVDGREFGVITSTDGFHFFDLSDASGNLEPVAYLPGTAQGNTMAWRDVKSYQHYIYAVADNGASNLQIFDVSGLPGSVEEVYSSNEFVVNTHNIFIDEANARLYMVGGVYLENGSNRFFSLRILSLENPEQPELLASFPNAEANIPYIHDLYVRDNIAYLHAGSQGFMVWGLNDPGDPKLLGTMTDYIQQGYNHSGWLSEDKNYYFMADETHGTDIKVVDMQDLADMKVVATMNAGSFPGQIAHNLFLQDGLLYVSYYYDGLQVYDVSNPLFPRRIASYDTYDGPDEEFFAGAWGVFVLPSGRPLVSDMNNGFYFFESIEVPANTDITPQFAKQEVCEEGTLSFMAQVGSGFSGEEVSLSAENSSGSLEVSLSATTVAPGEVIEITLTALGGSASEVVITATDGSTESESRIPIQVKPFAEPAELRAPTDGRENVALSPFFFWSNAEGTISLPKILQISTSADFEAGLVYEEQVSGVSKTIDIELEEGTLYYWRIGQINECGIRFSEPFSFTTTGVNNTAEISGTAFEAFPNPASHSLYLSFSRPLEQPLQVEWISISGQRVSIETLERAGQTVELPVAGLPAGVYILRLSAKEESVSRRVMIKR